MFIIYERSIDNTISFIFPIIIYMNSQQSQQYCVNIVIKNSKQRQKYEK